jgi:hypothetical protein
MERQDPMVHSSRFPIEEVDLHGQPGIALVDIDEDLDDEQPTEPVAALLPSLDPTPMGWKDRRWFLGIDPGEVFDRAGNIGPTSGGTARSWDHGRSPQMAICAGR